MPRADVVGVLKESDNRLFCGNIPEPNRIVVRARK